MNKLRDRLNLDYLNKTALMKKCSIYILSVIMLLFFPLYVLFRRGLKCKK